MSVGAVLVLIMPVLTLMSDVSGFRSIEALRCRSPRKLFSNSSEPAAQQQAFLWIQDILGWVSSIVFSEY